MKALPMWQPWASLVAVGVKRVETRAYSPARLGLRDGQRIAIYATKTLGDGGLEGFWQTMRDPFIFDTIEEDLGRPLTSPEDLPRGAIVCTCTLVRASQMTAVSIEELELRHPPERAFGFYEPGRWAWVIADVERLHTPAPARGSQGTFDWTPERESEPTLAQGMLL